MWHWANGKKLTIINQKELDSLYNVSNSAKLKTIYHLYWAKEYFARKEFAMAETQLQQCWNVMQDLSFSDREQAKLDYYSNMMNLKQPFHKR